MRYLSLFSGIEAATCAWHPLGWECAGVAEIEPFPRALLAHKYPGVPNLGDVTKVTEEDIAALGRIDLVVFGSPCQDLSVAGKRKGLAGGRSGLFFTALDIIRWARIRCGTRFALWENVPGAFTSNEGRDFAAVVGSLAGLDSVDCPPKGWGNEGAALGEEAMVEWSTLDAQWFGVAQRRRRVFAVADFGDWSSRPPVLLEPEGLRGDSAPSRQAGQGVAPGVASSFACRDVAGAITSNYGKQPDSSDTALGPNLVIDAPGLCRPVLDVARALTTSNQRIDAETETFVLAFNSNAQPDEMKFDPHVATSLTCSQNSAIAFQSSQSGVRLDDVHATLDSNNGPRRHNGALIGMQVRRLTPRECERLQAFPDDYTLVPNRGKPAADGPRYKALGNSMCVNVMRWIGHQIDIASMF